MGFLKQMKDMKNVVHEAPGMIADAQAMGAQAQQMAAAQQAAAQAQMGNMGMAPGAAGPDPDPINGVSLGQYASVCKLIANQGLDEAGVATFVPSQGISAEDWKAASEGWNARFRGNTALAVRYGNLYQQA